MLKMGHGPDVGTWRGIGRRKPGVSLEQALVDLESIFACVRAEYKWLYRNDVRLRVTPSICTRF